MKTLILASLLAMALSGCGHHKGLECSMPTVGAGEEAAYMRYTIGLTSGQYDCCVPLAIDSTKVASLATDYSDCTITDSGTLVTVDCLSAKSAPKFTTTDSCGWSY